MTTFHTPIEYIYPILSSVSLGVSKQPTSTWVRTPTSSSRQVWFAKDYWGRQTLPG